MRSITSADGQRTQNGIPVGAIIQHRVQLNVVAVKFNDFVEAGIAGAVATHSIASEREEEQSTITRKRGHIQA